MTTATIKADLERIAHELPDGASYSDAMYELYVRMKVAKARAAAERGDVMAHEDVKRRYRR